MAINLGVSGLCRMNVEQGPLTNTATVEVLAGADDWVCTRWG